MVFVFFGVLASGDGEPLVGPFKHWLEKRAKNPPLEKPSPTPEETLKAALDRPPSLNKWLSRLGPLVIICGAVLIYHGIFPHRSDGYIFLGCLIALAGVLCSLATTDLIRERTSPPSFPDLRKLRPTHQPASVRAYLEAQAQHPPKPEPFFAPYLPETKEEAKQVANRVLNYLLLASIPAAFFFSSFWLFFLVLLFCFFGVDFCAEMVPIRSEPRMPELPIPEEISEDTRETFLENRRQVWDWLVKEHHGQAPQAFLEQGEEDALAHYWIDQSWEFRRAHPYYTAVLAPPPSRASYPARFREADPSLRLGDPVAEGQTVCFLECNQHGTRYPVVSDVDGIFVGRRSYPKSEVYRFEPLVLIQPATVRSDTNATSFSENSPLAQVLDHFSIRLLNHPKPSPCPLPSHPKEPRGYEHYLEDRKRYPESHAANDRSLGEPHEYIARFNDPLFAASFQVDYDRQTFICSHPDCQQQSPVGSCGGPTELIQAMASSSAAGARSRQAIICRQDARFRIFVSSEDAITASTTRSFLNALHRSNPPEIEFALLADGSTDEAYSTFSCPANFVSQLEKLVHLHFPHAELVPEPVDRLPSTFETDTDYVLPTLPNERLHVIGALRPDPLGVFFTAFEECDSEDLILFRIAFRKPHPEHPDKYSAGRDLASRKNNKLQPFWSVRIRLTANSSFPNSLEKAILSHLGQYLSTPTGFQPASRVPTRDFPTASAFPMPPSEVARNLLFTDELLGLVHLPHPSLETRMYSSAPRRTRAVPEHLTQEGILLGLNEHRSKTQEVRLPQRERARHLYVIGASGYGKSTLLKNLIRQDIESGAGFAVVDPHGDLVADTLPYIPPERSQDLIYFNPADRRYVTPLNVLAARNPEEQALVADAVIVSFRRLVESWGDRMENILRMTVYTLLAAGNKTFADIERILIDPQFRSQVVDSISNPRLLQFWHNQFPTLPKNALDPITNKFSKFINPLDTTGLIFCLPDSKIHFPDMLQKRKIFLANLSQGQLGHDTSLLLGALIISQLQLAAMRRASLPEAARVPFTLYVDEFQSFTSDEASAFEKILSEARKYKLQLVMAHQFTGQLNRKVLDAIIGNVNTRIAFRVGADDASYLQRSFGSFTDQDLQNFPVGSAAAVVGAVENSFNLKTHLPPPPPADHDTDQIIADSQARYALPTEEAEKIYAASYAPPTSPADDEEEDFGRA